MIDASADRIIVVHSWILLSVISGIYLNIFSEMKLRK